MAIGDHPPLAPRPVSIEVAQGAMVQSYYASREMKIYPVAEHEVDALTMMNSINTILFGVGIALVSLALGIWVAQAFTDKVGPEGHVLSSFGAPLLIVLGLLCFGGCLWTWRRRGTVWGRIVKAAREG